VSSRYEVRLSGEGGQGLMLAGKILAEAAAIYDDLNATQSQSYGPEARGGASRSEVIISGDDIDYPKAVNIDLFLALTQESVDRYIGDVRDNGLVIVDSDNVSQVPEGTYRVVRVPVTKLARDEIGRVIVANIVALGIIAGVSKIVTVGAMRNAIQARVPKGTEEINMQAFELGLDEAQKITG